MAARRSYGDRCGIARALDFVGERWALLVVRELLLGPKRFTDLRTSLPHVGPDVLAQRLRELEDTEIVRRKTLPPPAGSRVYELTERGRELEPAILALGRWGSAAPFPAGDAGLGVDAFALALKTLFEPHGADGWNATYELRLDGQPFRVEVEDGRLALERGNAAAPVAVIEGSPSVLAAVLWHGRKLADAPIAVSGSRQAANRFLRFFPLPA
jgi:DNA-binding HxlR family transcriptional regulator